MTEGVYLDYNGSSPLDPRVADAMIPVLTGHVGNASSTHRYGAAQLDLVERARDQVAALVGGRPHDVVFTAGATEANNLALRGPLETAPAGRQRILTSAVEHASVRSTAKWMSQSGLAKVDTIPVTPGGFVDLEALEELLDDDVFLVSVMSANSETGILNDLAAVAEIAHRHGALVHTDATQYVGRLPFEIEAFDVDLVSISSHKICGPGGVGALIATPTTSRDLQPIIHGGGHEQGRRSGSLNVAGIVGFGAAAEFAANEQQVEMARVALLRDQLVTQLREHLPDVTENGDSSRRLPNTANLRFADADADAVIFHLDPVAVSTGSACSSGAIEPSPVLLAMGLPRDAAHECLRFSLGRFTTEADIETAIDRTVTAVRYVRTMNRSET